MTPPNKRRFLSLQIITLDSESKLKHLDFRPELLSTADLEKVCRASDQVRQAVYMELTRRCGMLHKPAQLWVEPKVGASSGTKSTKRTPQIDLAELDALAAEL